MTAAPTLLQSSVGASGRGGDGRALDGALSDPVESFRHPEGGGINRAVFELDPSQRAVIRSETPNAGKPQMWIGGALVLVGLGGLVARAVSKRRAR